MSGYFSMHSPEQRRQRKQVLRRVMRRLPPWRLLHVMPCLQIGFLVFAVSCGRDKQSSNVLADAPDAVQIGEEGVVRVERGEIVLGPLISGELRPAAEATVRAEIGGTLLEVNADEGESVRRGELLGGIEVQALKHARDSAETAVRSAESAVALARVEVRRTAHLVSVGALAQRDLDQARINLTTAEAELASARSNLASAAEQLDRAILRAPISGIVSNRAANAGDVLTAGTEIFTVIDPSSMRLEASVPTEEVARLRRGLPVLFDVLGYSEMLEGRIERINPAADPITRQVSIYVTLTNTAGRLLAGLFVNGRVITESAVGLIIPFEAVHMDDRQPWVLRIRGGYAERVNVTIGLVDERTERVQIISGISEGDLLLQGPARAITPGTQVNLETESN